MEQTSNINSTRHYGKPMLSEGLLIPMTEFVLNIDQLVPKDADQFFESWQNEKLIIIENYARFLNKPLELGMFFPCDIDGSRLNDSGLLPSQEQFIYRKSKEKVFFKEKPQFDEGVIKHHISQGRNVEYLANFGSMQLTQNAIDTIFG